MRPPPRAGAEFELLDTGIFCDDRYFDVFIEYAKAGPHDLLLGQPTAYNRGPEASALTSCRRFGIAIRGRGMPMFKSSMLFQ